MSIDAVRKQLDAILALLDAAAAAVQAAQAQLEPEPEKPCEHAPEDRMNQSTFGQERWLCKRCGFSVDRPTGSK
jgi:transposase-like protein